MNNLPFLRTFLAVYRTGSITSGARQLHLTQPAASGHIRALEQQLGRQLFAREGRGVIATPAAHDLAMQIAPHLDALEVTLASVRTHADSLAGTLYLGGPADFLSAKITGLLPTLMAQGIDCNLRLHSEAQLIAGLDAGDLDLAILSTAPSSPGIGHAQLYTEEFVLVGGPHWVAKLPASTARKAWPAALENLPLLAYDETLPWIRHYFQDVFGLAVERKPALVVADLRTLMAAASAGCGATVIPRYLCENDLASGKLVQLYHPAVPPLSPIYLAWSKFRLRQARTLHARDSLLAMTPIWAEQCASARAQLRARASARKALANAAAG